MPAAQQDAVTQESDVRAVAAAPGDIRRPAERYCRTRLPVLQKIPVYLKLS